MSFAEPEKRQYPRLELRAQQRLFSFSSHNRLDKNVVLSKNVSASGFCFRSSKSYESGATFVVYLDESLHEDIQMNRARVIKSGNFLMARAIWCQPSPLSSDPFYTIGCSFLGMAESRRDDVQLFVKLITRSVAERLKASKN